MNVYNQHSITILINAFSALQGGGQTYIFNLLENLENTQIEIPSTEIHHISIVILLCKENADVFQKFCFVNRKCQLTSQEKTYEGTMTIQSLVIPWVGTSLLKRLWFENFFLPRTLSEFNADVLFSPGGIIPLRYIMGVTPKNLQLVTVSQNMLPFQDELIAQTEDWKLRLKFRLLYFAQSLSFKLSHGMIFLSQFAQKTISEKISLQKNSEQNDRSMAIIPHGLSSLFWNDAGVAEKSWGSLFPNAKIPIPSGPYALYVSSFFDYKHQKELVLAWKQSYPKLLLVGDHHTRYGVKIRQLIEAQNLTRSVYLTGSVPYAELPKVMQGAVLNIFSSTCENCPNILLEYLASRRPVLCSHYGPMPEFANDAVVYFDPTNILDIEKKLQDFFLHKKYDLKSLGEKGFIHSKNYSWEKTRTSTWQFMIKMIKTKRT